MKSIYKNKWRIAKIFTIVGSGYLLGAIILGII